MSGALTWRAWLAAVEWASSLDRDAEAATGARREWLRREAARASEIATRMVRP